MFVVIKKSRLIIAIIILVAIIGIIVGTCVGVRTAKTAINATERKIPVYSVDTVEKKIALSFDAAWGSDKTLQILDILDRYNVKATFFLVGFWVDEYPDLVKEIHDRGHQIGNHSENHLHANTLNNEELKKEIISVNDKVTALIGETPTCFRAPFGEYNNEMLTIVEENEMIGVQWSVDSLDWKGLTGGEIADRVLNKVVSGDIILCHNNSEHILDALPLILIGIKNKNYDCVRIDELVMYDNYTIDNNGKQHQKIN